MNVLLLRHGRTQGNQLRRYIGSTDEPLSGRGESELRSFPPSPWEGPVYVTPLLRTRQTADILFPRARQICIPGLAEMHFGIFENRSADEMAEDAAYRDWVDSQCLAPCPGGESRADYIRRTLSAFTDLISRHDPGQPLICVCHGGTLMALLSALAHPAQDYWHWHAAPGTGYLARWNGRCLADPAPFSPENGFPPESPFSQRGACI